MTDDADKPHHPGSENLRPAPPWPPGQSGNPAGRKPGSKNRRTILQEMLGLRMPKGKSNPLNPDDQDFTVEKGVMVALINRALKGDVRAIQEIQDTMYGKNPDIVQGDPEAPIKHDHSVVSAPLTGDALKAELERRGLPTTIFQK